MHADPSPNLCGAAFTTPLGHLVVLADTRGVTQVSYDLDLLADVDQDRSTPALDAMALWIRAYFARRFDDLPRVPLSITDGAQRRILETVSAIPVGHTRTYGAIAAELGRPTAARAIGAAVARNPCMLLIPCHRVVAANGSLTGYAGGVQRKAWLLRHEGVLLL